MLSVKRLRSFVITSGILLASLLGAASAQAFVLQTENGERTNLLDHVGDGTWTVVMVWQLDCVICEEQKPDLNAFHEKYKDSLARVVTVAIDGVEKEGEIIERIQQHGHSYKNLIAFSDVYRRQYQELTGKSFRTSPTFIFFDPAGNLKGTNFGYMDFEGLARNMAAASGGS